MSHILAPTLMQLKARSCRQFLYNNSVNGNKTSWLLTFLCLWELYIFRLQVRSTLLKVKWTTFVERQYSCRHQSSIGSQRDYINLLLFCFPVKSLGIWAVRKELLTPCVFKEGRVSLDPPQMNNTCCTGLYFLFCKHKLI